VWLKNDWNKTEKQVEVFTQLRDISLATAKASHIKILLQDIFVCDNIKTAESQLRS
jgi:hypothetical protein